MKKVIDGNPISKKCDNNCPNCGANEDYITFQPVIVDDVICQPATCNKCGCEFKMYFEYSDTEFYLEQCDRVPCPYPLSKFYNTMDEVPVGTRVSYPGKDCEGCEEDCEESHCLISESVEMDHAGVLFIAAKQIIQHGNMTINDQFTAGQLELLAKAVKNYEGSIK